MSPTEQASERQRKAAYKAWETIRGKRGDAAKAEAKVTAKTISPRGGARKKWIASRYPATWRDIGIEIRSRSRNSDGEEQCECRGECLKHDGRCEEINRTWAKHRRRRGKVKIRLTIAHLCHTTNCDDRSHLRAMCEPCHLIFDLRCRQRFLVGETAVRWASEQRRPSTLRSE
jgi:hypothetical protein